tara:strand:- start:6012 stop:6506 length:495 start_codon:yes stop_codon:yes gene_type:complete
VYLRIKRYKRDRIIAYVGQSVSLLPRFDQHLSAMLALASPLRDASGTLVFSGDAGARLRAFGNLDRFTALAAEEVRRVSFFYALCNDYFHNEYLNLAEGLLQCRITQRTTDIENLVSAPRTMPEDVPDRWQNDFDALTAAGGQLLSNLLGTDPMTLESLAENAA